MNSHIPQSHTVPRHSQLLYPGRSHNSESSRHTACSWVSRALRRSRWCTRLFHLWARHGQGYPASPGCRWPQGYHLCQGFLPAPERSCHTGKNNEERKQKWKSTMKRRRNNISRVYCYLISCFSSFFSPWRLKSSSGLHAPQTPKCCHPLKPSNTRSQIQPHLQVI